MVDATTTVRALLERVRLFVDARDWNQFHTPKDLAIAISVEASELLDRFLWRAGNAASLSPEDLAATSEELADVMIYCLSLANAMHLDFSEAIVGKLAKDEAKYPVDKFRGRAR